MAFPKAIQDVVGDFERLPGIGPKSATRLAFYLINMPEVAVKRMADDFVKIKEIKICEECFGVSEGDVCEICRDGKRNNKLICVVERSIDVLAIENMGGFKGVYHVLGGAINPLDHIGPEELKISELIDRLQKNIEEIIIATNPTMEGEATALYIKKKIDELELDIKISRIGSGLPIGADLEFADQATLSRAMEGRKIL